jgi:hypothetical protein
MIEARQQIVATGEFGGKSSTNAAAKRNQFLPAQLLDQPRIPGHDDAQQRL